MCGSSGWTRGKLGQADGCTCSLWPYSGVAAASSRSTAGRGWTRNLTSMVARPRITDNLRFDLAAQPVHDPVIPEGVRQADQELAVFVGNDPGVIHPAIESTTLFDSQFTLQLAPHCMWVKSVAVYHGGSIFTCCGSARRCCDATASTCGVYPATAWAHSRTFDPAQRRRQAHEHYSGNFSNTRCLLNQDGQQ